MTGLSLSGASQSLRVSTTAFDRSAAAVASAAAHLNDDDPSEPTSSGSDMIDAVVGLQQAASGVKASVAVVRTADEMLGTLLDMRA